MITVARSTAETYGGCEVCEQGKGLFWKVTRGEIPPPPIPTPIYQLIFANPNDVAQRGAAVRLCSQCLLELLDTVLAAVKIRPTR